MSKGRNQHPRPTWLKDLPPNVVGHGPARLYFYLCAGGPNTCRLWNFRIAREFHVCRRTIQFWLHRLEELGLMTIEKRQSPYRSLHPVYFKDSNRFIKALQRKKIYDNLSRFGSLHRNSTAQHVAHRNELENTSYSPKNKADAGKPADSDLGGNISPQTLQKGRKWTRGMRFRNKGRYLKEQFAIIQALEAIERRHK